MKALIFLLGCLLILTPFTLKAWNGEMVPIPGINNLIDAFRGSAMEEEIEPIEIEEDLEKVEVQPQPDLSISRLVVQRDMKQVTSFENKEGYLRAGTDEEYKGLVSALSRFRVEGGAQAALDATRGNKKFPLFFSVALGEQVEEEPLHRVVGTATIEGAKTREEAYPLPKGAEWFTIGSNPLGTAGELQTPSFKTMREFVEREISPIVGSADKEAIVIAARAGFESDLEFFGVRATPGIMSAKIWRTYKGKTEEQIPAIRFLPFMESRTVSTHPAHAEARHDLAKALDLNPDRLEVAIKEIAEETNVRRALVSYWPHTSKLMVEAPSATTDVVVRTLSANDLWKEAYSVGSAVVGVQGSIDDLELRILDDLGLYKVVSGQRVYRHDLFPERFVRLTQESKSGAEGKIISYRISHELSPQEILNGAQLQAAIQRVLDQDPKQTHFQYGCLQSRKEIMEVFFQYQKGLENPADAFPCRLGYDYTTRSVVMFQKERAAEEGTTSKSRAGKLLGSYEIREISKKTIEETKKMVAKKHGVNIPADPEKYKSLAKDIIKSKDLSVELNGDKLVGGYLQMDVFKEGNATLDIVPE